MNTTVPPTADAMLAELASLGVRGARVVTRMMEIEQQAADLVANWLPEAGSVPASITEATTGGQALDMLNTTMADAVPRVEKLARALDRLKRSTRRTIALRRRIEAGWTGTRSDTRLAMTKRQVAHGVGEAIRRETNHDADGEAAERLFDDLAERLDDPHFEAEIAALPVEEMVRIICRELGLAADALPAEAAASGLRPHDGAAPPGNDTG